MFNPELEQPPGDHNQRLFEKRFLISEETKRYLDTARSQLKDWQAKEPGIVGMGFFGSRLVNNEKQDSDLDTIVFYDDTKIVANEKESIVQLLASQLGELNWNSAEPIPYGLTRVVDLSPEKITNNLDLFAEQVRNGVLDTEEEASKSLDFIWDMISPFMLAIGEGVYKARAQIFKELKERPEGEGIWEVIVDSLGWLERNAQTEKRDQLPPYYYPRTIQEAEKYFLTE